MSEENKKANVVEFNPVGTCCKKMYVAIDEDGNVIDSEFIGGCPGNLQAVKALIKGMNYEEIVARLKGIRCGDKDTSCPDQLAQCLISYKEHIKPASI